MRILGISAHTDDLDLAAGATLNKLHNQGHQILHHVFSGDEETLIEFHNANALYRLSFSALPIRNFDKHRQAVLDCLVKIRDTYRPDIVFTHGTFDTHQDHFIVSRESIRAFKKITTIGYNHPWNSPALRSNYWVTVSDEDVKHKLKVLKCYKSQKDKPYFTSQFTYSRLTLAGINTDSKYAEEFEVIRYVHA